MATTGDGSSPQGKFTGYVCPNCGAKCPGAHSANTHLQLFDECKAIVKDVKNFIQTFDNQPVGQPMPRRSVALRPDDPKPEPAPEPEPVPAIQDEIPPLSMAELASLDPLMAQLEEMASQEREQVEPLENPEAPQTLLRVAEGEIRLPAKFHALYDAYVAAGYGGSRSEWVQDLLEDYIAILGIDISIMQVTPAERELAIVKAGL